MNPQSEQTTTLGRTVGRSGFFTLAFGAVIGSGWVVVLGDWLKAAGPGGSALGFLVGGAVMIVIGLCYGELAARSSTAGAEFLYTLQTFGRFPAFLVGWFLTLYAVSVCVFEAIALAWMLRTLLPNISLGEAYKVAGTPITWDALAIGLSGALIVGLLHYRGARSAIRFQNIVTYSFLAVSLVAICCGVALGRIENLVPLFSAPKSHSWVAGSLWIFSTCAFFLNGWQTSLHAIEERREDVSVTTAIRFMLLGIAAASVFYVSIIVASAMAQPWQRLIGQDLPAAAAFASLGNGLLGTVILVAATVSLTKAWSACAWIATRLLFAQARHGLLPRQFSALHARSGAPRNAVLFVTVLTMFGLALGRGAITPIVNMLSICSALSIVLCLCVLLQRRRLHRRSSSCSAPGGTPLVIVALIGAVAMVGIAVIEPLLVGEGIPLEWLLLVVWAVIGIFIWFGTRSQRDGVQRYGNSGDLRVKTRSGPSETIP